MTDFSAEAKDALFAAGWTPGRRVDIADWCARLTESGVAVHDSAKAFLAEFGKISIEFSGKGISRAREAFSIDPSLCLGEEGRFFEWGQLIGKIIVPVGELDEGRSFLGIDEDGAIYLVVDWLGKFGSGCAGIESLVLGVAPETIYDSYPKS
ncbi:SUKH-3 domain-containing protein [Amycolatopsis coloradensis]|uniref:SUKH-3 domain-containing protein n=1 Tax=Amycolatopsis coloradensis TaxID=76021 RepID=UPI0013012465|nr:SUKH-3 domain-containing protein [Amycolatopsis coloradensis]